MAWITVINVKILKKEDIEILCENIKNKDPTWNYEIRGDRLYVFSSEKNQAYKRGTWLVKKAFADVNLSYHVMWSDK